MAIGFKSILKSQGQHLLRLQNGINQLNPQNELVRGYVIVQNSIGVVINSKQLKVGNTIKLTFGKGSAQTNISQTDSVIKNKFEMKIFGKQIHGKDTTVELL